MWQDEREGILDMAESTIFANIKAGDSQDAKWVLSRLGKERGYVERTETELGNAGDDPFRLIIDR